MDDESKTPKPGLGERMRAGLRGISPDTGRKVDRYLSTNLPDLIAKHNLALRSGLVETDAEFNRQEGRVAGLEQWRDATRARIGDATHRMELYETKLGLTKE